MSSEIQRLTYDSELYPSLLREIPDPPQQLYVRGTIELLQHHGLAAVVGSRKATSYGQHAIEKLIKPAATAGIPLVSGLAFGIDSLAHKLCLDTGAPTIAVLGGGIDDATLYPRQHIALAHKILDAGGALVSEYPPEAPALPHQFLARNRIIAGLAQLTIVVQAAKRSGSLTTARLALDANRDVMAVPGAITDSLAHGTNHLIQQGATPLIDADQLLDYFDMKPGLTISTQAIKLSFDQQLILQHLTPEPVHIDVVVERTGLAYSVVAMELTQLELSGTIANDGSMKYSRK